ncbi:hypothetical protein DCAR_0314009 [Daucus carota subsp. sativus]|uniref:RRM domain-containing protein n=1 Tax=Daucus carota subsp. sativus TaxID=79200 RepID=A0AAF1AVJ4_DAUCS|nr:hypothetical protein DCAR_0314009 [Daucus carota subsp. sativus]
MREAMALICYYRANHHRHKFIILSMNLRHVVVSKAINSSLNPNFSSRHAFTHRFCYWGFKGLQRRMHSSLASEDDFSDLGPPVIQGVNTRLKLATEKPEFFRNTRPKTEKAENARLIVEKANGTHPTTKKPKNYSDVTSNNKCHSSIKNSSSISIENVPSAVNMSELLESLSTFGKVSSSSMENVASGLDRCFVKYENEESSSRAISAGNITIGSFDLPIRPLPVPESVTIRINDIGNNTSYTAVHSICKTIGELVGVVKATENSVDALFSLKDYSETQNILAKLNDKIVDNCKWSAHLLLNTSSPEEVSKNERIQLGLQVSNQLKMLKTEMSTRKVYAEDLEYMHMAIMHLEEQHHIGSTTN